MKVLHVSTATTWRGGEQQIAYLVAELFKHRIEQFVLFPSGSVTERHFRSLAPPNTSLRRRAGWNPRDAFLLRRVCDGNGIDIIHAHDSHAHSYVVLSAALFGNTIPAVASRRVAFSVGRGAISRWKYNHRSVGAILCVSEFVRSSMRSAVVDARRLEVVHDGIDIEQFMSRISPTLRDEYNLPRERILIGNVAEIAPEKDYRTFLRVAERLLDKGLDATFFIVGADGGEERMIRRQIASGQLENRVVLTGFREDVPAILSELDLLLVTSEMEGLCTTVLDAYVAGTPVVATRSGGLPEIVWNQTTGLTAAAGDAAGLADAAQEVLNNEHLRVRLVAEAGRFVRRFSKEKMAERTLNFYHSTISESETIGSGAR